MKIKSLLPLIGIVILIFILVTLDFDKIINIFSQINPLYSFLSFFTLVPLLLIAVVEWQLLLRKQKIYVSYFYSLKNFFIGYFYGFITPGGFGAYTRALYLEEESKAPLPKCFSNIIIFNTVEFIAMLVPGAIGAIALSFIFPYLFYTIVVVLIIVILLFLFFFKKERSKVLFTRLVQTKIFATVKDRVEGTIDSFYEDLPRFKDVLLPFSLSLAGWFLKYVILFFIAKLFLIDIPFVPFILIMAVADVIASIPVSIYGVGTREASLLTMFAAFPLLEVTREQIVSFSLFWFVIIWLTPSIIGAFVTIFETKKFYKFELNKDTTRRFAKYMEKYPELYESLAKIVKKNIPRRAKKPVIVDLGVGPGFLSKVLNKMVPHAEIIGVDPSSDMLKLAEENAKVKTMVGSSENIPVKDGSADVVVSRFNLTYWKKPRDSFTELFRILKPGGKVVIEALNKDFSQWKLFGVKVHMVLNQSGADIASYHVDAYKTAYSIGSVKQLLSDSAFKDIVVYGDKKDWKFIVVARKK